MGEAQAAARGRAIGPGDQVISSPLLRARQTAAAIAEPTAVPVTLDARFIELDYGEWDQQPLSTVDPEAWAHERAALAGKFGGMFVSNADAAKIKAAKKLLAREGYAPQFGARPLKRAVQACLAIAQRRRKQLLNPLSMKLLEGEFKPGDKIKVTANDDELVFQRK